jgi:hypothetical protein
LFATAIPLSRKPAWETRRERIRKVGYMLEKSAKKDPIAGETQNKDQKV